MNINNMIEQIKESQSLAQREDRIKLYTELMIVEFLLLKLRIGDVLEIVSGLVNGLIIHLEDFKKNE